MHTKFTNIANPRERLSRDDVYPQLRAVGLQLLHREEAESAKRDLAEFPHHKAAGADLEHVEFFASVGDSGDYLGILTAGKLAGCLILIGLEDDDEIVYKTLDLFVHALMEKPQSVRKKLHLDAG